MSCKCTCCDSPGSSSVSREELLQQIQVIRVLMRHTIFPPSRKRVHIKGIKDANIYKISRLHRVVQKANQIVTNMNPFTVRKGGEAETCLRTPTGDNVGAPSSGCTKLFSKHIVIPNDYSSRYIEIRTESFSEKEETEKKED